MKQMRSNALLLLTAVIWGCAFVAQSVGLDYVGPFTLNSVRYFIAALVLVPAIMVMDALKRKSGMSSEEMLRRRGDTKTIIVGGVSCGVVLAMASSFQQVGLLYTSAGKAGFITAMYIVLVPIFGIFVGKKARPLVVLCIALAVVGLYFLCMTEEFALGQGDILMLLCAAVFSVQILLVAHFSPLADGVRLSAVEFLTAGIVCGVPMLIWEKPALGDILSGWLPILYTGAISGGVGYTLQMVAQRDADPTVASLLMSTEAVFSVLAGWIILGEALSAREMFGCVLMMAAIVLSQLPEKKQIAK